MLRSIGPAGAVKHEAIYLIYRYGRVGINALTLKETKSNEESLAMTKQAHM